MSSVRINDRGWGKIMEAARDLAATKPYVAVGIIGAGASQSHGDGVTNVDIAVVHEYGSESIPQRSFIASTIEANAASYTSELAKAFRSTVTHQAKTGGAVSSRLKRSVAIRRFGMRVQSDIQRRIADGIPPPNSPVTIARKGSSKPLIDSGQMRQSVSFEVRL